MNTQKLIDDALKQKQDERKDRKRSGKFSPSSFGRCFRFQYWNRKGLEVTDPPDERALRLFRMGDLVHDFVKSFYPAESRELLVDSDDVLGYVDIVDGDTVVEIKSIHSNQYHRMCKPNYNIKEDKKENILQACAYAVMLGKPKFKLVFVSKDDLCIQEFVFDTKEFEGKVVEELTKLRAWWFSGEVPVPGPRAYGGKEGSYCSYRTRCYEGGFDCSKNKYRGAKGDTKAL